MGFEAKPRCSACFILSIDDSMESILDWIRREGDHLPRRLRLRGSTSSASRSSKEQLSKGGYASGPVSFMRGADASAGTIKSGGKTRRAAKMVVLDIDHPDVEEFIWCKAKEERKARVLESAGYDMSLDSPDWASIQYQNANNSVRVTDAFMEAVVEGRSGTSPRAPTAPSSRRPTPARCSGRWPRPRGSARTPASSTTRRSTPGHAPEHEPHQRLEPVLGVHVHRRRACNLASLNLLKFRKEDGELDIEAFEHAVDVVFLAQEIAVGYSSYPTSEIDKNAKGYRQLGLGYANLGALLMARGLPYDSDEGRAYAAAITALMTGRAYRKSAEVAKRMGPFAGYRPNAAADDRRHGQAPRGRREHRGHAHSVPDDLLAAARRAWDEALDLGEVSGWRNAQATVLAPTGTISFMMDCDTTGVEPDFSLVKSKKLVGGGEITIVNKTVPMALEKLGYAPSEVEEIAAFIDERNTSSARRTSSRSTTRSSTARSATARSTTWAT